MQFTFLHYNEANDLLIPHMFHLWHGPPEFPTSVADHFVHFYSHWQCHWRAEGSVWAARFCHRYSHLKQFLIDLCCELTSTQSCPQFLLWFYIKILSELAFNSSSAIQLDWTYPSMQERLKSMCIIRAQACTTNLLTELVFNPSFSLFTVTSFDTASRSLAKN